MISSFLTVWMWVTCRRTCVTRPNTSPILTTSPTWKMRRYTRMYPAMMLETADEEPSENITPAKMEMPRNAGDDEPGM